MTTRRPWYPFNVGHYRDDTEHLTTLEHGAYVLLMNEYWAKGGLPTDDKRLAIIAKMRVEHWRKIRAVLEPLFKVGLWRHKRIDAELAKADKISAIKRASAEARWSEEYPKSDAYASAHGYANGHAYGSVRARDSTIEHKNIRKTLPLDLDPTSTIKNRTSTTNCPSQTWTLQFDQFWEAWPNKVGKPTAKKAFEKIAKRPNFDYEAILEGVRRYIRDIGDKPWLNPSTFLNQERWNDEPAPPRPAGKSNGQMEAIRAFLYEDFDGDRARSEDSPSETIPMLQPKRR